MTVPWNFTLGQRNTWNLLLLLLFLAACNKTDPTANVQLTFSNTVNGEPMALQSGSYTNAEGEPFTISAFKYYLCNFALLTADGRRAPAAAEHFLINEGNDASKRITLRQVPEGQYTGITFTIGVDSVRNFSGDQTGALDPVHGMFWTWNSGYIMAKLEGHSPVSYLNGQILQFHIGGYKAPHNARRQVTLQLPQPLQVQAGAAARVDLAADAYAWFNTPNRISFKKLAGFMTPGSAADSIADNYQHMFTVKSIAN